MWPQSSHEKLVRPRVFGVFRLETNAAIADVENRTEVVFFCAQRGGGGESGCLQVFQKRSREPSRIFIFQLRFNGHLKQKKTLGMRTKTSYKSQSADSGISHTHTHTHTHGHNSLFVVNNVRCQSVPEYTVRKCNIVNFCLCYFTFLYSECYHFVFN